jgi:hypothetical protein
MHDPTTHPTTITCHACGALETSRRESKLRAKACAYCGARRRSQTVETVIDRLLFGK